MHKVIMHEAYCIPIGQRHSDGYLNVTVKCEVVGEVAPPQSQENKATPWTPPPLYPDMKEETFKAMPYHDQVIFMETAEAREERERRDREEIRIWELHYPKTDSANSQSRQSSSTSSKTSIQYPKSA